MVGSLRRYVWTKGQPFYGPCHHGAWNSVHTNVFARHNHYGHRHINLGFFLTHSIASSLVGQVAVESKGHAASLYHVFYYAGSSLAGVAGGWFFAHDGWSAVVFFALTLMLLGALIVRRTDINDIYTFKKAPSAPESLPV